MTLVDRYISPPNHFGNSPQFIPRGGNPDPGGNQTEGYLACVVLRDGGDRTPCSEIWIFDAQNLAQGPICKLGHPTEPLLMGLTIHTTWVSAIAPRTAPYRVSIPDDFDALIAQQPELVKQLFREQVYPPFAQTSP